MLKIRYLTIIASFITIISTTVSACGNLAGKNAQADSPAKIQELLTSPPGIRCFVITASNGMTVVGANCIKE